MERRMGVGLLNMSKPKVMSKSRREKKKIKKEKDLEHAKRVASWFGLTKPKQQEKFARQVDFTKDGKKGNMTAEQFEKEIIIKRDQQEIHNELINREIHHTTEWRTKLLDKNLSKGYRAI